MSSTSPTKDDVARLVSAVLHSKEFSAGVEEAGLAEEKVVERIWTERAQIWETASHEAIELQGLQTEYDSALETRVQKVVHRQRLLFRDAQAILFTTLPLLVSLYVVARNSETVRAQLGSVLNTEFSWLVGRFPILVVVLVFLFIVTSRRVFSDKIDASLAVVGRFLFVNIAVLSALFLIIYAGVRSSGVHSVLNRVFLAPALWLILPVVVLLLLMCIGYYQLKRIRLEDAEGSGWRFEKEPEFVNAKKRIEEQEKKVEEVVTTQGIKTRVREMLERRLDLPFSEHLPMLETSGLAEVFNSANEVATHAKGDLEFMLENMPGGSIGIAGPRGSGKSTLLRSACKERPDNLTKYKVIPLLTSSPVEYDGREFILHLFSSMCDKVLVLTGGNKNAGRPVTDIRELNTSAANAMLNVLRALAWPALMTGAVLITLSLYLAFITMDAPTSQTSTASAQSTPVPGQNPAAITASPAASPTATSTPTAAPTATRFVRLVKALDLKPGTLFVWGLVLSLPFSLVYMLDLGPQRLLPARRKPVLDEEAEAIAILPIEPELQARLREARETARRWQRDIKFQQSYTSGWSGAIKLPIGLEGGMNDAVTLAQQQLSLPDITKGFSDFVSSLGRDFKVIIGIDELDKLESDESAQRFLNEIKAVFGLSKVFYLISVSENAMSNFERRGVPFRDVFDSSFDNIVYVDYLSLEYAKRLIARRVVGMPPPFVHLCYCISGGLARDLVRTCRNLIQLSQKAHESDEAGPDSNLKNLSAKLIKSDLRLKLHALTVVARKVSPGPSLDGFLNTLQSLETVLDSAPSLVDAYVKLMKAASR